MVKVYTSTSAPGFAKHSSSFKNDERCEDIYFIVGSDYNEVATETLRLFKNPEPSIDYDIVFSLEGDAWVGVVTRDKESND